VKDQQVSFEEYVTTKAQERRSTMPDMEQEKGSERDAKEGDESSLKNQEGHETSNRKSSQDEEVKGVDNIRFCFTRCGAFSNAE